MANKSVETDSENINIIFVTNENKVSSFTTGSLQGKFLAKASIDKMKDVGNMFPQPAAVTFNKTRFEKQQVPTFKSNEDSWRKSLGNLPLFTINPFQSSVTFI